MADSLLTSLCSICHVSTPKYKCPRCQLQTCSAACVKKHKAWSECSGERDATVSVPRSQLRTVAGVNHDYNFLHKMDLSVERAERTLVGDKGLVRHDELRPQTVQQVRWKTGRDGRKKVVVVATKPPGESGERRFERFLAHRLRQLNIQVTRAPQGMARQRENGTTFNRRSGGINWQVEWLFWGDDGHNPGAGREGTPMARCLSKVLEDVSLYQAYQAVQDESARSGRKKAPRSGRREEAQRSPDSTWNPVGSLAQDPLTGHWVCHDGADVGESWPREIDEAQRRRYRFFLGAPPTGSNLARTVAALEPTDCLRDVLANTRVLEYPTLYVLRAGEALPPGVVAGPKPTFPAELGTKRRMALGSDTQENRVSAKRRKQGRGEDDVEEGEVDGAGEGEDVTEAAEAERAESSGEDHDGEYGSSTSSSGTDSESD